MKIYIDKYLIDDVILDAAQLLPDLPKNFRYYDDFNEKIVSIKNFHEAKSIHFKARGRIQKIDFTFYEENQEKIIKSLIVLLLSEDLSPITVGSYINEARHLDITEFVEILSCGPSGIALTWVKLRSKDYSKNLLLFVRSLLRMLSIYRIGGWTEEYLHLLHNTLPLPAMDKYKGIRTGDAFLSIDEEARIVSYLDKMSNFIRISPSDIETIILVNAVLLVCSYQFGMRPLQIAYVRMMDVKKWNESDELTASIHLTFPMIKQKKEKKSRPLIRKIKAEWSNIVGELHYRRQIYGASAKDKLCAIESSSEAGTRIFEQLKLLFPGGASATDLRHTAAQRMADTGASKEELAEFLGHSDVNTCLVYFIASANQNERVNKALGISDIYSSVARISREKYISVDELSRLKDEQQIAGVPHGIPIAGIGGCSSGQPLCPSNPILACYGCHKFMPVHEIGIHEQVLDDFRNIINTFRGASRDEQSSPAFLQLQHTISSVQAVIEEIKGISI